MTLPQELFQLKIGVEYMLAIPQALVERKI